MIHNFHSQPEYGRRSGYGDRQLGFSSPPSQAASLLIYEDWSVEEAIAFLLPEEECKHGMDSRWCAACKQKPETEPKRFHREDPIKKHFGTLVPQIDVRKTPASSRMAGKDIGVGTHFSAECGLCKKPVKGTRDDFHAHLETHGVKRAKTSSSAGPAGGRGLLHTAFDPVEVGPGHFGSMCKKCGKGTFFTDDERKAHLASHT